MGKITRIGVVSDTHYHRFNDAPLSLLKRLKSYDLVLHLGDFVSPEVVEYFRGSNNFYGVAGNHDPQTVKKVLPRTDVIEVNGKRLGLLHGYWAPLFCDHRSLALFSKDKVDAIVYGHTHIIRNERKDDILWFNPGSASARFPAPWKTFGVLNIGESITGEIVSISDREKAEAAGAIENFLSRDSVIRWVCGSPRSPDYSVDS